MIDITKEEFWNSSYEETEKVTKGEGISNKTLKRHKLIKITLISLGSLITVNILLIYNFFKILETI